MFIRQRRMHLQRRRHRSHSLSIKNVLRTLSSLLVPLMLGVFTVFITVYQHISSQEDRREDLRRGDVQRDADIERFMAQRREDRNETQKQREQELTISKQQRQQEWNISQTKQESQNKVASNRYQDEVLKDYIKDISDLIKENNGSLTSNRLTVTLARMKTINVLRQLDGSRLIHVIRFLHEVAKLADADEFITAVMSKAELTNVDFQKLTWSGWIINMSFPGLFLRNCTFGENTMIKRVNFTSTRFYDVNFSSANLDTVDFSFARFLYVNFSVAKVVNTSFSSVIVGNINFSFTKFRNVNFSSTLLFNINFLFAEFNAVTFSFTKLDEVNFSSAKLNDVDFSSVHFDNELSNFYHAQIARTKFTACNCRMADFSYANLSESLFWNANLMNVSFRNADLTKVNFSGANLWNADFTNATITDAQLQDALSIRNAKLPNGTLGLGKNLIKNGGGNCSIRSIAPWYVQKGKIAVVASKEDPNDCQFVLQSHLIGATMWQRINLTNAWNSTLWAYSSVELHFSRSSGVSIELNDLHNNGTMIQKEISNSTENEIMMRLQEGMVELEVLIKFDALKYTWCDNIELFVNYNMSTRNDEEYLR